MTQTKATSIGVLPGTEDSIAVVQSGQLVVFDDGVRRAHATGYPASVGPSTTTYSKSLLYGFDGYTSGADLYTICVDATGAYVEKTEYPDFSNNLTFAAGVLYSGGGGAS